MRCARPGAPQGAGHRLASGRPNNKEKTMPKSQCETCGHIHYWRWEEAFDKFGFNDGDGQIETGQVRAALEDAGYCVDEQPWGCHNIVIVSIKLDGVEQILPTAKIGYDDPRDYLPAEIITLLDEQFPGGGGAS
jgi:hypothetical protein